MISPSICDIIIYGFSEKKKQENVIFIDYYIFLINKQK